MSVIPGTPWTSDESDSLSIGLGQHNSREEDSELFDIGEMADLAAKVNQGQLFLAASERNILKTNTANANNAAIYEALDEIEDAGGGHLYFDQPGSYLYNSISREIDNLTISGNKARLVSTLNKTVNTVALRLIGNNLKIEEMDFDYVVPIDIDEDSEDRPAGGHTIAFGPDHDDGNVYEDLTVYRCRIWNSRNTPIAVRYGKNVNIERNSAWEALGNGIVAASCESDVRIENNNIFRTGDDLIAILGETGVRPTCKRVFVKGNTGGYGYANGIDFTGVDGGEISGNHIFETWAPGIIIFELTSAQLGPSSNISVYGNRLVDCGTFYGAPDSGRFKTAASTNPDGILITGVNQTQITVFGNNITGSEGRGIAVANNAQAMVGFNNIDGVETHGVDVSTTTASLVALNRAAFCGKNGFIFATNESLNVIGNTGYNNAVSADGTSDNFIVGSGTRYSIIGNKSVDDRNPVLIDVHYDLNSIGAGLNYFAHNSFYSPNSTGKRARLGNNNLNTWAWGYDEIATNLNYSASINFDTQQGSIYRITATDGLPFTINNPGSRVSGRKLTIVLINNVSSAPNTMGDITWGSDFKVDTTAPSGANNKPAFGKRRVIEFVTADGVTWLQRGPASGDL